MKNISIIVHLNSGGLGGRSSLAKIQQACRKNNISYNIYISQYPKHTTKLICEVVKKIKDKKNNRVVVIGGDGTLSEAVGGLVKNSEKFPIAYFPSGTGNDFARSLGLTTDANKFLKELFSKQPTNLEIVSSTDKIKNENYIGVNGVGFGFDALVSHLNNKNITKSKINSPLKRISYLSKIKSAWRQIEPYTAKISIDGGEEINFDNIFFASFMKNNYFGGGIKIDPINNQNNGKLGLIIAKDVKTKSIPHMLYHVLFTERQFEKTKTMIRIDGSRFNIKIAGRQYFQSDGEVYILEGVDMDISLINYPFYLVKR